MGFLNRLFGKPGLHGDAPQPAAISAENSSTDTAAQPATGTSPKPASAAEAPAASTVEAPAEERPVVAAGDGGQADGPPLRSLRTYQKDPAYKNFMDKVKRPPGIAGNRARNRHGHDTPSHHDRTG